MKVLIKLLFLVYKSNISKLFISFLFAFVVSLSSLLLLGISGWFITKSFLVGSILYINLFVPSSLIRVLSFSKVIFKYIERISSHSIILKLLSDLRILIFSALVNFTPRELANYRNGDLIARMTNDVDILDSVYLSFFNPICIFLLSSFTISWIIHYFIFELSLILLFITLIICIFIPIIILRILSLFGNNTQKILGNLRSTILDTVEGHKDIINMNSYNKSLDDFQFFNMELEKTNFYRSIIAYFIKAILIFISSIILVMTLWFSIDRLNKYMNGPELVAIILVIFAFFELFIPVINGVIGLNTAVQSSIRIMDILNDKYSKCSNKQEHISSIPDFKSIKFIDVNFSYTDRISNISVSILKNINLTLNYGEFIVITGPSGSGKTTLLNILLRLEKPETGIVKYNEIDVNEYFQEQFYRRTSFLSQDNSLFLGTLRSNLLIGNKDSKEQDIWKVLEAMNLKDFVSNLSNGLDSWIGESGINLSFGQARRLCLARALLSDAQIILLDEPTAGLDKSNELFILKNLKKISQKRSILMITHSDLAENIADRCYALVEGNLLLKK